MAKAIFQNLLQEAGLFHRFEVDSSGFSPECVGRSYHPITRTICEEEGLKLEGKSRLTQREDLERFDYILAMDEDIQSSLLALDAEGQFHHKVRLLREFSDSGQECFLGVPDPVQAGPELFEEVYDLIDDSCRGLLRELAQDEDMAG